MKRKWFALGFVLVLLLAACGPAGGGSGDMDVVTLLDNVEKASKDIRSMHMEMKMDQEITMPEGAATEEIMPGGQMNMSYDIQMDMIVEPMVAQMTMKMEAPIFAMLTGTDSMEFEMYLDTENVYMKSPPIMPDWQKEPIDADSQMGLSPDEVKESMVSDEIVAALKEAKDNVELKDAGDNWEIIYKGDGKDFQKVIDAQLSSMNESESASMNFKSVDYRYVIDKKTHHPKQLHAVMETDLEAEGSAATMKMTIDSTFSKINQIDKLEIPAEVLAAPPATE